MFNKIKNLFIDNSGKINVASYTVLIIAGVTGYSNLMKEHGNLEATVGYQSIQITNLKKTIDRATDVYSKLNKDYKSMMQQCIQPRN